jgi:hypothetical protein
MGWLVGTIVTKSLARYHYCRYIGANTNFSAIQKLFMYQLPIPTSSNEAFLTLPRPLPNGMYRVTLIDKSGT